MKFIKKLTTCVAVSTILLVQPVVAEESELVSKVQTCSKISDSQARLNCFDKLTDSRGVTENIADAPSSLTEEQIDDFAKDHVQKSKEDLAKEINSITLVISKLTKSVRGQWKITFENGQRWQQQDASRIKLKQGNRVILTKGALGSVYMQKENTNKRIKVKRLK
ncbi:hypothetical protein [Colwellia psychrerythraea]|uniref:Lipoprotein n=1 Tax=Colwellia psychrerythraea TaxID=28229 RepID=A0A099L3G0_COLPS|nr:hypothetical protein [Colwellia psychrerythraea]KGJ97494.1 hypothetical protein GAB14E_1083 [Colwellia psychrerythraea]